VFFDPGSDDSIASINGSFDPDNSKYESVRFEVTEPVAGGGPGSLTPPEFSSGPMATPNTVTQGDLFNLSATVDNVGRGGTDIITATWADKQGNSGNLSVVNGTFDHPIEAVESEVDTTGWNTGVHNITVTATDGNDNSVSKDVEVEIVGSTMASQVSTVDNMVTGSNIAGGGEGGGGSRVTFDFEATESVMITGFSVTTANELSDVGFTDDGSTVGGTEPPTSFTGQVTVDLLEFETNNIQNDLNGDGEFVDPDSGNARIIISLEFSDGSVLDVGIR
jgi:hypothetical protein